MTSPTFARCAVVNLVGVALLGVALISDALSLVLAHDTTRVSWVIAGLMLVGVGFAFTGRWGSVKWLAEKLPALGLAATVYGILVISSGAIGSGSLDAFRMAILQGVGSALGPSFMGIAGYIWLSSLSWLCAGEDY